MSTDSNPALAGFGPNEWLVEEMYQKFLQDPSSVDAAWHEFFADYQPKSSAAEPAAPATTANNAPAPASARATAPAPAPAPAPTAAPKPAKAPARQARKPAPAAAAPAPTAQPTAQ
ncbi:MAG: 2-oxoglutarate dehydrogenase E1 subunit family protein, partial [Mycobacteriales bacterium]